MRVLVAGSRRAGMATGLLLLLLSLLPLLIMLLLMIMIIITIITYYHQPTRATAGPGTSVPPSRGKGFSGYSAERGAVDRGCSGSGVQWIGVVLHSKLVYNGI